MLDASPKNVGVRTRGCGMPAFRTHLHVSANSGLQERQNSLQCFQLVPSLLIRPLTGLCIVNTHDDVLLEIDGLTATLFTNSIIIWSLRILIGGAN